MKIFKHKKGFTLIEVLITTGIMVSVLAALAYGLSQCSELTKTSGNSDIALSVIQDKLEEIADSDDIADYDQVSDVVTELPSGSIYEVVAEETATDTDLWNVSVTVTWPQSGGRLISRELSTTFVQK